MMTPNNQAKNQALWHEIAGGAHALAQIVYLILILSGVVVGAIVRAEVINAHNDDKFAAIEARRAERAQERLERRQELLEIHADVAAIKIALVRLESKVDSIRKR